MSESEPGARVGLRRPWRELRLVLALFCAGGLIWTGWVWWAGWRDRNEITAIESDMKAGRFAIAARRLSSLVERNRGTDEIAYLLGACEQARGRIQAADEAWARVAPASVLAREAVLARMRLFHDRGRLAAAEQVVNDAAEIPGADRSDVRAILVPIYSQIGRLDDAQTLIKDRWEHLNETGEGASERAIDLVRMHIELAFKPNPVENVRAYLDQAARMAPDDDRVWLGRANLALRTGAHAEAKPWLDACLKRRPQDPPVWLAWLSWAMATDRVDAVELAMEHLPSDALTPAQIHRLGVWLAFRRGDIESERRELNRVLAAAPADLGALDRLAQLAKKDGQPALAADFARKKSEMDQLRARYEKLYDRRQPIRDAAEMASLAERLGRAFEARAFLTLAIEEDPDRDDLRRDLRRLNQETATIADRGRALAEALAHEPADSGKVDAKPSR